MGCFALQFHLQRVFIILGNFNHFIVILNEMIKMKDCIASVTIVRQKCYTQIRFWRIWLIGQIRLIPENLSHVNIKMLESYIF